MSPTTLLTAVLALCLVVFIYARQMQRRLVTQRGFFTPLLLGVVFGGIFLMSGPAPETVTGAIVGALLGVGTGLVSGQFLRVWRDDATGLVYQQGGWRYLVAILGLVLARVLIRFAFNWANAVIDETALNDAFIAAIIGNFLGRSLEVSLRALPLAGGSFERLPRR